MGFVICDCGFWVMIERIFCMEWKKLVTAKGAKNAKGK